MTVPVTPSLRKKVVAFTVFGSTDPANVAVIGSFTCTPVVLFAGVVALTVGGVVSAAVAVKLKTVAARGLPAISVIPVVSVAVYVVPACEIPRRQSIVGELACCIQGGRAAYVYPPASLIVKVVVETPVTGSLNVT